MSDRPEYRALLEARRRCVDERDGAYPNYGGRGIEYRFPEDIAVAVERLVAAIGPRPRGMSLDRIDNDGHYEVGNLRWATRSQQQRNRRAVDAAGRRTGSGV